MCEKALVRISVAQVAKSAFSSANVAFHSLFCIVARTRTMPCAAQPLPVFHRPASVNDSPPTTWRHEPLVDDWRCERYSLSCV